MADYITELNRREVLITRFASYLLKEYAYPSLQQAVKSVRAILLDAEHVRSRTKLTAVERQIKSALLNPMTAAMSELESEMRAFAITEAEIAAGLLSEASGEAIKTPAASAVIASATNGYMTLETASTAVSAPYAAFQKSNVDSAINLVIGQIRAGFSKNETVKQLAARVSQVVNGLAKNHIDTLVRTGVAFYAQQSRNAMRDENLDVIEREYPIVTFDNQTSFTCMSISDKYPQGWKAGQSPIGYPPYHYGCRTIIGYWTQDRIELEGTRAAVGGLDTKEAQEAAEKGELNRRNRKDKDYFDPRPIAANTPFSKFLKSQPKWYIKQQLGKQLAEDFISGKVRLADLTDINLKPLSLAQINARG